MAVSIWEGNKAQALIDAIKQTNKIDKRQGTANAGKALVVGDDGLVGFGNAGISNEAKLALLACFQNVAWNTDRGKILYDDLRDALLGHGSSHVLYELPSETVFDGTNYINTGVRLFEEDRSYTYTVDFTENADFSVVPTRMFVIHCIREESPYIGIGVEDLRASYTGQNTRLHCATTGGAAVYIQDYSISGNRRIKAAMSHEKGSDSFNIAVSVNGTPLDYNAGISKLTYDPTLTHNQPVVLGAGMQVDGTFFRFFKGTIHSFELLDYAYSQNECDDYVRGVAV